MAEDSRAPLPLDEPSELTGVWWVPGTPDRTAYGRLAYTPEAGLELNLASGSDIVSYDQPAPWLNGVTVAGRSVTLRNCFARAWSMSMPGGIEARAYVEQAFIGIHAASARDLSMLSLNARMQSLSEWLERSGIDMTAVRGRPTQFRYTPPDDVPFLTTGGTQLSGSFELIGEATPARAPFALTIEQRAWLNVVPRRRRPFDELRTLVTRFNNLLSFASGIESQILELVGVARVRAREFGTRRTFPQRVNVWVLYAPPRPAARPQTTERMLFRYDDADHEGGRPLLRWFRRSTQLEPVTNLYLSGLPARTLHIEYRFLAFIQALEAYHRRKHPGSPTLRNRLDQLVAVLPAPIKREVPAAFTQLALDTRNYFTHWDPKLEARAAKGEQLVALTMATKLLFDLTMLRELGFKQTTIANWALSDNQRLVGEMQRGFVELQP